MANNEHINKVVKSTGETLIDLTGDTVTAETLLKDVTAHDRSGAPIVGEAVIPTVNDGTLTIQQNGTTKATFTANQSENSTVNLTDTTYSAGDTMTLDNTTFDIGKRWTAVSKGQTWSRLFYSDRKYVSTGSCGILTLGATRPYVVYNASFLVIASASTDINQAVKIIQMSGARYSSVRVRAVTDKASRYYFEIYDTAHNIAVGTEQSWNCRYIPLLESTLTPYTSFTDGTTIPTNWVAVNDFTTGIGSNAVAIKNITRSGNTFTATKQDGSTFTFDQNAALATNATVTLDGAVAGTSNFNNNVATINTKRKGCVAGNQSGTTSATPYYKVASLKKSLAAYQTYRLALYVQQVFGSNGAGFGILDIDIRTNANSLVQTMDSKWLISASGINPEDFILVYDKTAGSIDIYCKCYDAFRIYRFIVLSESNLGTEADNSNVWTLYNDTTGIAELPTGDNIVIAYSSLASIRLDGDSTARFKVKQNVANTKTEVYMLSPNGDNGIYADIRDATTILQFACGQASNANGKVVFLGDRFYGGIGNPTSDSVNNFKFNDDCVGDSIGKLSSGAPLTGSEFNLNYETINLKGSAINIDDNMSMAFETVDNYTVNTINSPYMIINTDGISLSPKTLNQFALLISGLPSGAGSEIVIGANGDVYKSSSSRDIKHDIQYIENTESYHDALMRIKPATYIYNNDKSETTKLGMIAEDVADVMPIAALTGEDGKVENYDTRAIIAMLVMEVQRLNAEIERLRGDSNAD